MLRKPLVPLFILVVALAATLYVAEQQRDEIQRLKANQQVLLSPETIVEYRTTSDGKTVAQIQALNLQLSELKSANDSLLRLTHDLGIRNRRLLALAQTTTATTATITAPIINTPQTPSPQAAAQPLPSPDPSLPCISFADPWLTLDGCIRTDTFTGTIHIRDTLDFIAHRIPRRFLFFRFGTKAIQLDAVTHNPYTQITHARYIRLTK